MGTKCEVCGKQLQSRKAYAGHMLLAHQKRVGFMAEFDARMQEVSRMQSALVWMAELLGSHVDWHDKTDDKSTKMLVARMEQFLRDGSVSSKPAQVSPKTASSGHSGRVVHHLSPDLKVCHGGPDDEK